MNANTCKCPKEDTLWGMARQFYSRKMASVAIIVWVYSLIFIALAIFAGIKFFAAEQTKLQIMYAVIFLSSIQFIVLMKIFAWQMIHRKGIKDAIKRLEDRMIKWETEKC